MDQNDVFEGDPRIRALNPDLLFVQNLHNRPAFTDAEVAGAIAARAAALRELARLNEAQRAGAESLANRPFLSPPELKVMIRGGILPVGHPHRAIRRKKGRRAAKTEAKAARLTTRKG